MRQYRIRKDDKVMIVTGKDKGKIGKILKINRKKDTVVVERANIAKRHTKPNPYKQQAGGIQDKEMPMGISNVMLVCAACTSPVRVGYRFTDDGKKVRFCKKCNEVIA